MQDELFDGEEKEEPQQWQRPVACPSCGSAETRLVEMHYEVGLYECEKCGTTFEEEE